MTINKTKLKKIIKEEVQKYLSEYNDDDYGWDDDEEEDPYDDGGRFGTEHDDEVHPDDLPRLTRNSWD
tara:strand:- start:109 stop:312 length:204 start_codon:yes stop_codon:yes gene_type:complete